MDAVYVVLLTLYALGVPATFGFLLQIKAFNRSVTERVMASIAPFLWPLLVPLAIGFKLGD